jgi:hypothetical protein
VDVLDAVVRSTSIGAAQQAPHMVAAAAVGKAIRQGLAIKADLWPPGPAFRTLDLAHAFCNHPHIQQGGRS